MSALDRPSRREFGGIVLGLAAGALGAAAPRAKAVKKRLYVATPGIRDYLEYGGHGLIVFDIDDGHKFVKRIPTGGTDPAGKPRNVKGVAANADTHKIYVATTHTLTCLDLLSESILWEKEYEGGCDRMAIAPDGSNLYLPSFEKDHWNVVDGASGAVIAKITPKSGSHNTVYGLDGKHVYLAGLRSPLLTVAETRGHTAERTVGPFADSIRPFTVNGRQSLVFVNVNGLLGFEIGDLKTGKKIHRVEVKGFKTGPVKRHGCPSHGIGLTPDETEIWVSDATNRRIHVFDNTVMPPKPMVSLELRDEPGWVTFGLDGKLAYPSTGEVFDVATKKIVATLTDETGRAVQSEKLLELTFDGDRPVKAADQFGLGRVRD